MFKYNLAYEASAGSGKTFMLVVRYLSILFKGASPSKILALTFTNKAAFEMQERIALTLEELENRGEIDVIADVTGLSRKHLLQNRKRILDEFLNANTKIMTIDKFFTQILRKFSLYASLMPDFTTMSSQHELKLLSRFLKEVSVVRKKDTLITLSLQSKKRLGDIFKLLEEFYVKQQELSYIKFEKQNLLHYEAIAMDALEDLRNIVENCNGASTTVKKAVDADSFEELASKSWIGRESLNYRTFSKCFIEEMDIHLKTIQEAIKNQYIAREQNFFYALNDLTSIYKKAKKALYCEDGELSFNDVSALVYYILKEGVDNQFLYFRLDAQIEHILLDEFQDTSILQYEILRPMIEEVLSGNGVSGDRSFFFVGDVKQSIYRFRGGVSALFGAVKDECRTEVEPLLTNYRSQREIIEFVNKTFINKISNYASQNVRVDANGGFVEVISSEELLQDTLEQVKRLMNLGSKLNDIAILCATNGDGEAIKQILQDEKIDVVTETTTKLINQRSVKAILEYLKYLYFGEDIYRYNFFALINQDIRKIPKVDLTKIKLLEIVKRVIIEFGVFDNDFNLIRFLEVVYKYEDIEALLFEYEREDTTAAASELNGVRVLTIHKSKGLEYQHVIVMDRLKKAPPARDAIIYEYEGIKLQNVYLRIKGRDGIDVKYANALKKEKSLALEDSLNALYVAFTRAKKNLFIIKKEKDSAFDILDLEIGSRGELIESKTYASPLSTTEVVPRKEFEFQNLYYGTQSDILKLEKSEDEDLKAINFGLALHYTLEMLGDFSQNSISDAIHIMRNKYGYTLSEDEVYDIKERMSMLVKDKIFKSLITKIYYKEKAIRYKNNLRYIDLLVRCRDGSWNVIDYKSALGHQEEYLKQVRYYVKAVQEITGDEVRGYVCYILKDNIRMIEV